MKTTITIIVAALAVSTACADEPTFDSIQDEFRQKAISLLSEKESSAKEFQGKVAEIASTTFGSNPNVMKKEAASRFKRLPPFPVEGLTGFIEHKSWDQFSIPPSETGLAWIIFGYEPKNIADLAKKAILGRNLTSDQLSRRAFVAACCPDQIYRHGEGEYPDLVVDSLGDLFVIKVEMTNAGYCRPASVRWMKKKAHE